MYKLDHKHGFKAKICRLQRKLNPRNNMEAIMENEHPSKHGTPQNKQYDTMPNVFQNGPNLWLAQYPWPKLEGNKYQRGHVLIYGGLEMTGASRLAARGALRIGAGVVTLAVPKAVWHIYAASLISEMVRPIDEIEDYKKLLDDERHNALIIGPGASVGKETRDAVLMNLATKRSVVLDAGAITSFEAHRETLFNSISGSCVMTPHEGEFARLFDVSGDRLTQARAAAQRSGAVILLKGRKTIIAAPDGRAIINANAPSYLATAGSGDVLAGFIGGLLAQGLPVFEAAAAAVWLHGEAATEFGEGLISTDLPDMLPPVLQRLKALTAHSANGKFRSSNFSEK